MFLNKTAFWVLAATLGLIVLVLLIPAEIPPATGELVSKKSAVIPYMEDIALIWDKMFSRYIQINFSFADLINPVLAAVAGICIVVGVDIAIRRRADRAIKRSFTYTKDKR